MAILTSVKDKASATSEGLVRLANDTEATTGTATDVAMTPAAVKAQIDALLDGAPAALDTLNELAAAINDDASFFSSVQTDINDLQTQINTLAGGDLSGLQDEIDDTQVGAGLGTDGSYTADATTNYITAATSLKNADFRLDAQIKTNADAIATLGNGNLTAIQTEIDAIETSVGLAADGTKADFSSANYIVASGTFKAAIEALDTQLKSTQDDLDTVEASLATAESEIDTLQTESTDYESRISSLEGASSNQAEVDAIEASVGIGTDGSYTATSGANYTDSATSVRGEISALDTQVKTNEDAIALRALDTDLDAVDVRLTTAESEIDTLQTESTDYESRITSLEGASSNQAEVDAIEASVGLGTDGSYTAPSGTNYIDSATSVRNEAVRLDTQVKTNEDAIASNDSDISTINTTLASKANTSTTSAIQSELNATQTAVGTNADGTYSAHSGSNYIDGATTTKAALGLLDAQVQTNETDITNLTATVATITSEGDSNSDAIDALQLELDTTQTGAGLSGTGAYTAPGSSNYLASATSLKSADNLLDTQIKTNADAIALKGSASDVSTNTTNIATNTSDISTNTSDIATNLAAIQSNDSDISSLQTDVAAKASSASVTSLQSEVDDTQAGAGLGTNGAYSAHSGSNYITGATTLHSADNLLDGQIKTNADAIALRATSASLATLQSEVDDTQSGAGLGTDGTYTAPGSSNYLSGASSLKSADSLLDTQIKTNTDAIALRALDSDLSSLQSEVDATQTGAGLAANGNFVAYSGTNYIDGASNLAGAISTLDAAVQTRQDNIDTEASTRSTADTNLQSAIDTIEASVGLGTDGSFSISGTNLLNSTTDVIDALEILDTNVNFTSQVQANIRSSAGLQSDGTKTNYANTNYISNTDSLKAAIEALDVQVSSNADDITGLGGTDISNLQTELNDTQTGVGLSADGDHVARSGTNYIDSATSIVGEITALDTALKTEETARTSADNALDTRLDTLEHRCGGIFIDIPASTGVEMDATLSQFRTHGGPWEINWSTFVTDGEVDIVMYGGQAVTNSSQHFIQNTDGDIVFTGNITPGASIYDDA